MYESGIVIAFILVFIVLFSQGLQRQQEYNSDETMSKTIIGALFGSVLFAGLSWLVVAIMVLLLMSGNVWGTTKNEEGF
jgi:uncharacterized membrane protein